MGVLLLAEFIVSGSKKCRVLVISTQYMQVDLNMTRPRVFVSDTTFNTNEEGFKVGCYRTNRKTFLILIHFSCTWSRTSQLTPVGLRSLPTFSWRLRQRRMFEME